jgi:hypothetical protein
MPAERRLFRKALYSHWEMMNMRGFHLVLALAAAGLLAAATPTRAENLTLGMTVPATATFADPADDNNLLVFGFCHAIRNYIHHRAHYSYSHYRYSYHQPYYSYSYRYSYHRPYYTHSYYIRPYYTHSYYIRPYYSHSYYYRPYYYSYGYRISGSSCTPGVVYSLSLALPCVSGSVVLDPAEGPPPLSSPPAAQPQKPVPPMPKSDNGTYPYDGGPTSPAPIPGAGTTPPSAPAPRVAPSPAVEVPATGRLVSAQGSKSTGKWIYPAYGEQPRRVTSTTPVHLVRDR